MALTGVHVQDRQRDAKTSVKDLSEIAIDIKKNGYRLLTSAEYEYVTRAGTTTTYFWNTDDPKQEGQSKEYAWSVLNATTTTPIPSAPSSQQIRCLRHHW